VRVNNDYETKARKGENSSSDRSYMQVDYVEFKQRADRTKYIVKSFGQYLSGKLLDVGCDKGVMRQLLPEIDYLGIDIAGEPDLTINLEKIDRLPFKDGQFDSVLCSDVLEHLDNLHWIFDELVRVSRRHLIISLPNNWTNARRPLERGTGSFAHYGLPLQPPADRHKWFFSLSDALGFFEGQAAIHDLAILNIRATERPRPLPTRIARRIVYQNHEKYLNRYAHTLWAVFEKKGNH
jgi:SAM-dependent methyltransferase